MEEVNWDEVELNIETDRGDEEGRESPPPPLRNSALIRPPPSLENLATIGKFLKLSEWS